MSDEQNTQPLEPVEAPGRAILPVENRVGADAVSGSNHFISWGCRSDVGLVRGHNEDSFIVRTPLFVVSDGMGGHAAGEVASSIAVETIGAQAPAEADDILLGAAVESAKASRSDAEKRLARAEAALKDALAADKRAAEGLAKTEEEIQAELG